MIVIKIKYGFHLFYYITYFFQKPKTGPYLKPVFLKIINIWHTIVEEVRTIIQEEKEYIYIHTVSEMVY